jgi:hypothetical protein
MKKLAFTVALLAGAATALTGCEDVTVYPSGCIRRSTNTIQPDWTYDGASNTWWDPQDGFIGYAITEDSYIWTASDPGVGGLGHRTCAETNGRTQIPGDPA